MCCVSDFNIAYPEMSSRYQLAGQNKIKQQKLNIEVFFYLFLLFFFAFICQLSILSLDIKATGQSEALKIAHFNSYSLHWKWIKRKFGIPEGWKTQQHWRICFSSFYWLWRWLVMEKKSYQRYLESSWSLGHENSHLVCWN